MRRTLTALCLLGTSACLNTYEPAPPRDDAPAGAPRATEETSREVPALRPLDPASGSSLFLDAEDASLLLDRIADEGPPEQSSRLHSCMKLKFDSLGRVLASRGANMKDASNVSILPVTAATNCAALGTSTNAAARAAISQPARFSYCDSRGTLGLPQYTARLAEPMVQTTASSTKMHDLFLAAAPEIIANFATASDCRYKGQQAQLFDAQDRCDPVGVACLIGYLPGAELLSLCNELVQSAEATPGTAAKPAAGTVPAIPATPGVDAVTTGKRIAVAALLSAAHMCE